jgi:membrane-bound lytic murein transglycosylase D
MKQWIGLICVLAVTYSAIGKSDETIDPAKRNIQKDSATVNSLENMGFKNLFISDQYNPSKPYSAQVNPMAVVYVKDYISRHGKELNSMKVWAQPYFRMMDNVLTSYGIPKEMKYLAVIESHLQTWAMSWVGAAGPWQFMPATGRRMGLTINGYVDERANYFRSTHAAAKYLKELYGQLGDWLLVIAAYNGGPGRVFSAIRRSGSRDFWKLQQYLPEESRNHVKKFIGTHYVMEGDGGVTTSTADEWAAMQDATKTQASLTQFTQEELNNTVTATLEGKYNSVVVSTQLGMDISQFNRLNANFDKLVCAEGGCTLRLPKDKMDQFQANRYIILRQSLMSNLESAGNIGTGYPEPKAKPSRSK